MNKQKGFTLIELMIVLAIIGILAAIALPAYQDYTKRARVAEAITLADGVKTAVADYFANRHHWPVSNQDAGLPSQIQGNSVHSITIGTQGVIVIEFNNKVAQNAKLSFQPSATQDGSILWQCRPVAGTPMNPNWLPSSCRNESISLSL